MRPQVISVKRLEDALRLFQEKPDISRYLSGGTQLLSLRERSSRLRLIPIGELLDQTMHWGDEGFGIKSGATLQDIQSNAQAPSSLREACRNAYSRTLRSMATIGGNIAAARDDSYLLPVLTALNASVKLFTLQLEKQTVKLADYLSGSDVCRGALILQVVIPDTAVQVFHRRAASPSQGKPAVSVAVSCSGKPVIAVSASSCGLLRLVQTEQYAWKAETVDDQEINRLVRKEFHPSSDTSGSAEYKQYLAGVLIAQALRSLQGNRKGVKSR